MIRSSVALLSVLSTATAGLKIGADSHTIPMQPRSFPSIVAKQRSWQVSAAFFYDPVASASTRAFKAFDAVAAELEGMFKFVAVDCSGDSRSFCEDQIGASTSLPAIAIYPRDPMPQFVLENSETLKKTLQKLLTDEHVTKISSADDPFFKTDTHIPQVLLFSSNSAIPPLFKALSNELRKEMHFGFIQYGSDAVLDKKFKVTKAPTLVINEHGKQPLHYKGALKYKDMYAWANVRRETFVKGGGFSDEGSGTRSNQPPPAKPWLTEQIPELTRASGNDVCFKHDTLCLIFLKTRGPLTEADRQMLSLLKSRYDSELVMTYAWMDMSIESGFRDIFDFSNEADSAVVFNPHKRLRFAKLPDDMVGDENGIKELVERIVSGEGRFIGVKGQKLPEWAKRTKAVDQSGEL